LEAIMPGQRYALLVANWNYADTKLPRLSSPLQDVAALENILRSKEIGFFDDVQIATNVSSRDMRETLEHFATSKAREDLLLIYFSGHGVRDSVGSFYLAAVDTKTDSLRATGIDPTFLQSLLNDTTSKKKILLLDCCFAGAVLKGFQFKAAPNVAPQDIVGQKDTFEGELGLGVITATGSVTFAFEQGGSAPTRGERVSSVFTKYLVHGLQTGVVGDSSSDIVRLDDLYDYLRDNVQKDVPAQKPERMMLHDAGTFVVAKRMRGASAAPSSAPLGDTDQPRTEAPAATIADLVGGVAPHNNAVVKEAAVTADEKLRVGLAQRCIEAQQRCSQLERDLRRAEKRVAIETDKRVRAENACRTEEERAREALAAKARSDDDCMSAKRHASDQAALRTKAERDRQAACQRAEAEAAAREAADRARDAAEAHAISMDEQRGKAEERARVATESAQAAMEARREAEHALEQAKHEVASESQHRTRAEEEAQAATLRTECETTRRNEIEHRLAAAEQEWLTEATLRVQAEHRASAAESLGQEEARQRNEAEEALVLAKRYSAQLSQQLARAETFEQRALASEASAREEAQQRREAVSARELAEKHAEREVQQRAKLEREMNALQELANASAKQLSEAEERAAAESERRKDAELQLVSTQKRAVAEGQRRAEAEQARINAEGRLAAETQSRIDEENARQQAEQTVEEEVRTRKQAEIALEAANDSTKVQIQARIAAEDARDTAEKRAKAETALRQAIEKEEGASSGRVAELEQALRAVQQLAASRFRSANTWRGVAFGLAIACAVVALVQWSIGNNNAGGARRAASLEKGAVSDTQATNRPLRELATPNAQRNPSTGETAASDATIARRPVEIGTCRTVKACVADLLRAAGSGDRVNAVLSSIDASLRPAGGDAAAAQNYDRQGLAALKAGKKEEALSLFQSAQQADPRNAEYPANICDAYNRMAEYRFAIAACESAVVLVPDRTSTWQPLAEAYASNGQQKEAIRALWLAWHFSQTKDRTLGFIDEKVKSLNDSKATQAFTSAKAWIAGGAAP
jgi:hypothetical protein